MSPHVGSHYHDVPIIRLPILNSNTLPVPLLNSHRFASCDSWMFWHCQTLLSTICTDQIHAHRAWVSRKFADTHYNSERFIHTHTGYSVCELKWFKGWGTTNISSDPDKTVPRPLEHSQRSPVPRDVSKHSPKHNLQVCMLRWLPQLGLGTENGPLEVSICPARVPRIGVFPENHWYWWDLGL